MRVRLVFCLGLLLQSVPALAELVTLKSALENIYQQSPDIQQLQANMIQPSRNAVWLFRQLNQLFHFK
jgi:hypothetical protein